MVRRHSDSDSTSVPSSLITGTASKSMSRTQSESGDQRATCYSTAPSPLSIVDQTKYRLRKKDVCNSPHRSPKSGSSTTNQFSFEGNSFSPSCGSLGGASTLGVLYEDPEEDLVSLMIEDDKRRLIIDEDSSDEDSSSPNAETFDQTATAWKLLEEEICDISVLMNKFSSRLIVSNLIITCLVLTLQFGSGCQRK